MIWYDLSNYRLEEERSTDRLLCSFISDNEAT